MTIVLSINISFKFCRFAEGLANLATPQKLIFHNEKSKITCSWKQFCQIVMPETERIFYEFNCERFGNTAFHLNSVDLQ